MRFTFSYARRARFKNSWKIKESFREAITILGHFGYPRGTSAFHGLDVLGGQREGEGEIAELASVLVSSGRLSK